jgi:hypothetical protein
MGRGRDAGMGRRGEGEMGRWGEGGAGEATGYVRRYGAKGCLIGSNPFPVFSRGELSQVKLADESRKNVRILQIVVVAGSVEVGWHNAQKPGPVLAIVGLAELDPGDFCNGVRFVGRFEQAGQN